MKLERIIWKGNCFVKESDKERVEPSPRDPIFSSYHPESMDYVDDITDFISGCAEFYKTENNLPEVNAFEGEVVQGEDGGDFVIVKLYKI